MTWRCFDAGAAHRKLTPSSQDCQVRALATARGIGYLEAWLLLYEMQGERRACAFTLTDELRRCDPRLGVIADMPFPAVRGKPRMTAERFCKEHPKGRFILRSAHHVAAVKDGVLYDTWDSSTRCVYYAWEIAAAEL